MNFKENFANKLFQSYYTLQSVVDFLLCPPPMHIATAQAVVITAQDC